MGSHVTLFRFAAFDTNPFFGMGDYGEMTLNIDYGAMEAYNVALQAGDNFVPAAIPSNIQSSGHQFDVVKAMFNQVDMNQDGSISRAEFQRWAQAAQPTSNPTSYSQHYQTVPGSAAPNSALFAGASPEVARILQQSGLGQGMPQL
jgi:hypothetical protein